MKMSVDQALRKARGLSPAEAEALYREILGRFPGNRRVLAELEGLSRPQLDVAPQAVLEGIVALYGQGRLAQARDRAGDQLLRMPNSEILHNITGAIHAALGDQDKALGHYDRALALAPDYAEAHINRGNALNACGRAAEALASFDAALTFEPDNVMAHANRGIALRNLKQLGEALASYGRAIGRDPRCAEAYNNRGNALLDLHRSDEALADFDRAIACRAHYAEAYINRGNALKALKRPEEAIASYDHAIALAPARAQAHGNRGIVLKSLKQLDEALASHRRALDLMPESTLALAEIRYLEAHMCLWTGDAHAEPGLDDAAVPPFYMLAREDDPQAQLASARAWTAQEYGSARPADFASRAADGRIRIGYFSADFHNHATMYLVARLFELHDRSRFEIHAFSYGPDAQDAMRQRLLDSADAFHDVAALGDDAVAALARSLSIDIAIDLKGHTQDGRPGIFAHRAAPVQVNYLGYPGTMGADFIDHIIADAVTIPVDRQGDYAEKVAYLPHCYQPNDDRRAISDRVFSRAELGLPEAGFVFCCFNHNYKITPDEYDIWMRLLIRVEGSVLWLLKDNDWAADNLRREAEARGVSPDRLVFADRMPLADHLARHRQADLFLDTFRVNAHTTASDALWAGLPVVTRLGSSFVARVAGSLLHALDMPELVTDSAVAYEQCALALATDAAALGKVKARLAANRQTAPLFDTARYTRDIEALYAQLLSA